MNSQVGISTAFSAANQQAAAFHAQQASVQPPRPKDGLLGVVEQYQSILRQAGASAIAASLLADRVGGAIPERCGGNDAVDRSQSGVLGQLEDIASSLSNRLAEIEASHARLSKMIGE